MKNTSTMVIIAVLALILVIGGLVAVKKSRQLIRQTAQPTASTSSETMSSPGQNQNIEEIDVDQEAKSFDQVSVDDTTDEPDLNAKL